MKITKRESLLEGVDMKSAIVIMMLAVFSGCGPGYIVDAKPQEEEITPPPALTLFDPCPDTPTAYPEQLMCVNGEDLYAVYHNPPHTFLSPLPPGNYKTTDVRECKFTVVEGCEVK